MSCCRVNSLNRPITLSDGEQPKIAGTYTPESARMSSNCLSFSTLTIFPPKQVLFIASGFLLIFRCNNSNNIGPIPLQVCESKLNHEIIVAQTILLLLTGLLLKMIAWPLKKCENIGKSFS